MRFYEFEAKRLLGRQGVRLPAGGTAEQPQDAHRIAADIGGPVGRSDHQLPSGWPRTAIAAALRVTFTPRV